MYPKHECRKNLINFMCLEFDFDSSGISKLVLEISELDG